MSISGIRVMQPKPPSLGNKNGTRLNQQFMEIRLAKPSTKLNPIYKIRFPARCHRFDADNSDAGVIRQLLLVKCFQKIEKPNIILLIAGAGDDEKSVVDAPCATPASKLPELFVRLAINRTADTPPKCRLPPGTPAQPLRGARETDPFVHEEAVRRLDSGTQHKSVPGREMCPHLLLPLGTPGSNAANAF